MISIKYINDLKKGQDLANESKNRQRISNDERDRKILEKFMVDKAKIIKEFQIRSSEILKASKVVINNSVNGKFAIAKKELAITVKKLVQLNRDSEKFKVKFEGDILTFKIKQVDWQALKPESIHSFISAASEECLEARLLLMYLSQKGQIDLPKESVFNNLETYVGGLCDMCGELQRKARLDIIGGTENQKNIKKYYEDMNKIYDILSSFAFSNGSGLRSKVEHLKSYIAGLENMLYDLKIVSK